MTDATVEQQGEPKRRREHLEVPQATDSRSSSSSSSESSTDTEMGLVDVRTILSDNSEVESRCRGGPVTLDLTEWDFSKADCRNKCRKVVENSKPLLLIGSPIDSVGTGQPVRAVLHLAFICELYEIQVHGGRYSLHTHSHSADSWERSTVVDFMNRFPDSDWPKLVWPKCPSQYGHADEMVDRFRLHRTGTKLIESLVHGAPSDCECNVPAVTVRPECRWSDGPTATSSLFAEAGYSFC